MATPKAQKELDRFYYHWREISFLYEVWAKDWDMSFNAMLVLYSIHANKDNCTQKMICDERSLPKQTTNSILKEFEKRALVRLSVSSSNKRNKLISLTPAGERQANAVLSALNRLELYIVKNVGVERMGLMNDALAAFAEFFRQGFEKTKASGGK